MADLPIGQEHVSPDVAAGGSLPMVNSATEGGRIGEAIQFGGEVAAKEHYEQQLRYSQAQAMEGHNQLHDWMQDTVMDPEKGVLAQNSGKASPGVAADTMKDFDLQTGKIRGTIKDPQAQQSFDRMALESKFQLQAHMNGYVSKQLDQYQGETTKATVANSIQSAVNSYSLPDDPATGSHLQYQLQLQRAAIENYWGKKGDPETVKPIIDNEVATAASRTYAAVANDALTKGNTDYVRQLMSDHGSEIDFQQRNSINEALKTTDLNQRAFDKANQLLAPEKDQTGPTTRAQFMQRLDADPDLAKNAELYDRVFNRGERHIAAVQQATRDDQGTIMDKAEGAIYKDPSVQVENTMPAADWERLDNKQKIDLQNLAQRLSTKEGPKPGGPAWINARHMVGTDAFLSWNPLDHFTDMTGEERKELVGMQADQAAGKRSPKAIDAISDRDILHDTIGSLGLTGKDKPTDADEQVKHLQVAYYQMKAEQEAGQQGKPLTSEQKDALTSKLVADYAETKTVPAGWIKSFMANVQGGSAPPVEEKTSKGPLYMQDMNTIRGQVSTHDRPLSPVVSPDEMNAWRRVITNQADPSYRQNMDKLKAWRDSDDPILKARYRQIRASLGPQRPDVGGGRTPLPLDAE